MAAHPATASLPEGAGARRGATVADAVGAALADPGGVADAFGVVGSGNLVVTNALCAGGARFHAARHEGGAICMADGYARVSGRVGVCSVHQGPGLTNAMTGLAEAAKARTPLLVLAGDSPPAALRSNFRIDQHGLVESVGAIAERIHSPASAAADALRALRRAEAERRPVVLMLPIDMQVLPAVDAGAWQRLAPPPLPPRPADAAVAAAADLLVDARAPVLIAGRGAVLSDARESLAALAERCGALLATSAMAHGLFAGLPCDLRISGGFSSPYAAELLAQADVVLAFGATLNHWTTRHGALIGPEARLVQVDLDASAIGAHRPPDLAVVADVAAAARALGDELARRAHRPQTWRTPQLAEQIERRRWRDEPYADAAPEGRIDPRTLSIALEQMLPPDRTVAVDSGHFLGFPAEYLSVPDARSWVFPNAFQSVGLGLGCAIGAAVARPERLTVAAVGDGGLFMALEELETAVRLGLKLLVVAYDDAAYGAEVHHFAALGHATDVVRFPDADLAALARAAGAQAVTVREVGELAAIESWLAAPDGPLVVDAKVDPGVCDAWLEEAFRAG